MKRFSSLILIALISLSHSIGSGCGGEGEKEESGEMEKFRIPDSVLSPYNKYNLIINEFDPEKGGVMANKNVEVRYPGTQTARFVSDKIFKMAAGGYGKVKKIIGKPAEEKVVLVGTKDLDSYTFRTGKSWWYYGVQRGDTIIFEPFNIMIRRKIAEIAVTQKMAQMALGRVSGGKIPPWLRESVASEVAGEQLILESQIEEFKAEEVKIRYSPAEVDTALKEAEDRRETRIAFWNAYRMLEKAVDHYSMDAVIEFVRLLGKGKSLDEASMEIFGINYGDLLDRVRMDREG